MILTREQRIAQRRDTVSALKATDHHRRRAAEYLGISKQALGARIRKFKIKSIPYTWAKLPKEVPRVAHNLITLDMESVLDLYRSGMTYEKLGLHFKCTATCIKSKLVKHLGDKFNETKELNSDNRNRSKHGNTRNRPRYSTNFLNNNRQ